LVQEQQEREEHLELADERHLGVVLRVDRAHDPEPHVEPHERSGQLDPGEDRADHESQRRADEDLAEFDPTTTAAGSDMNPCGRGGTAGKRTTAIAKARPALILTGTERAPRRGMAAIRIDTRAKISPNRRNPSIGSVREIIVSALSPDHGRKVLKDLRRVRHERLGHPGKKNRSARPRPGSSG
jgi:hypothetical protein